MDHKAELTQLMKILGHQFSDAAVLEEALTHTSLTKSRGRKSGAGDYERLEFLGDRVLGIVIAEELFSRYSKAEAGQLSRRFNAQVQRETLAEIATKIGLSAYIRMSKELSKSGGRERASVLEDCMEAVIAALYLDGGMPAAKRFIKDHWWQRFDAENAAQKDPKSELQEWTAKVGKSMPIYKVLAEEGPDHNRLFTIEVSVEGLPSCEAKGKSKRAAEKEAAARMLKEQCYGK